jgi:hypothetical protein
MDMTQKRVKKFFEPKMTFSENISRPSGPSVSAFYPNPLAILNSLSRKLLQSFYLPTRKQYGEYMIEFKSFHQNGNISETVA